MIDYQKELNTEQLKAVMGGEGPCLVLAGPGSGKTRTLVFRICKRLDDGIDPKNILLLTFTNKAAKEMRKRIIDKIGEKAEKITAGTFHHFANLVLRRYGNRIGIKNNFTILDENDCKTVLKQILLKKDEKTKKGEIAFIMQITSLAKLNRCAVEEYLEEYKSDVDQEAKAKIINISDRYEKRKKQMNTLDFDDLIYYLNKLLEQDKEVRERYQQRYRDILVDEYQDTDKLQASIIENIYRKDSNLMVVGDDFQSIYSFRGASIENILAFKERYKGKIFYLENNYRSTENIVNLVNNCMKSSEQGMQKKLRSIGKKGSIPNIIEANSKAEEAWAIAEKIQENIADGQTTGVLFRATYFASELEVELSKRGIDYDLRGGMKFFEQRHVKDIISILRVYENARDSSGVVRLFTLFPGIGEIKAMRAAENIENYKDAIEVLEKIEKKGTKYSDMLKEIYSKGKNAAGTLDLFYEKFYRNYLKEKFDNSEKRDMSIEALIGIASRYENTCEFLASFSLDQEEPQKQGKVVLSTIHQAKGLEWDSVFIICAAEGMLPIDKANDINEERRLFYVAASRARNSLTISYPRTIGRFYDCQEKEISRFIQELPDNCYAQI